MLMESNDMYQDRLNQQKQLLQECQQSKGLTSCFDCELVEECETRDNYVKSVYASMNKGQDGGFEF